MLQELKFQLSTAILTILTVAAAVSATINFSQQWSFRLPDDGVTWVDRAASKGASRVQALRVVRDSGAANAGLRAGDILLKINALPIVNALYVPVSNASSYPSAYDLAAPVSYLRPALQLLGSIKS